MTEPGSSSPKSRQQAQFEGSKVDPEQEKRIESKTGGGHPWQAVWDPTRQAWYFWNPITQETTWTNPLESSGNGAGEAGGSSSTSNEEAGAEAEAAAVEKEEKTAIDSNTSAIKMTDDEVAQANGIDPDLAYLDPGLYASQIQQARTGRSTYSFSGAFDSRTGKFVPLAATGDKGIHDPSRLSHANQADRQMSAFFDVQQYEEERKRNREEREEEEAQGTKRKKQPTKKELQRYKERAKEKKAARYGWLRE